MIFTLLFHPAQSRECHCKHQPGDNLCGTQPADDDRAIATKGFVKQARTCRQRNKFEE